jgi:hypothetical protein
MNRPTPAAILRKEHRERKRVVRAGLAEHGVPKVEASGSHFGIRDAIALNPWCWCEGCGCVVREKQMVGELCAACYYAVDERRPIKVTTLKAKGDALTGPMEAPEA